MNKSKILIIIIFLLPLCSALVSATDVICPPNESIYTPNVDGSFDITVENFNFTGTCWMDVYITHNISHTPPRAVLYRNVSVTGGGVYNVPYYADEFSYKDIGYTLTATVRNSTVSSSNTSLFSMGDNESYPHYVHLQNSDPWHLDFTGGVACSRGVYFQAKSLENIPLYFFVTDNSSDRKLIDVYGVRSLAFDENYTGDISGTIYDIGQIAQNLTIRKDNFNLRRGYYIYFGVMDDYYGDIGFSADNTFSNLSGAFNFSTSGWTRGATLDPDGHSKANDFYGFSIYFETFPREGDVMSGWTAPATPSTDLGNMIRDYFDDMGFAWGFILIGIIPPAVCVGMVYQFGRKFQISMPNFIYALMIDAGSFVSYAIGLFDFWMTAFIIAITTLTIIYVYREPLNIGYQTLTGMRVSRRRETYAREALSTGVSGIKPSTTINIPDTGVRRPQPQRAVIEQREPLRRQPRYRASPVGSGYSEETRLPNTVDRPIMTRKNGGKIDHLYQNNTQIRTTKWADPKDIGGGIVERQPKGTHPPKKKKMKKGGK